ncbi:MAG: dialkylresorcinol condensing enzyme [Gammaproteobacteria bacterium]|nr:dialkylresorcinol condensing enzyme [Gammaproteobacteria bacterium]MDH5661043.1 dialkylresorcinol condensing enzyme [Gammaproteobacteria bacterium]
MPEKKVLIVQYSQSGQLTDVVNSVTAPLAASDAIELHTLTLNPETPYPFPWPVLDFFNIFPECVYLDPPAIKPLDIEANQKFDLVIIAYQVWFLSPSMPVTAFLKSAEGKRLLQDTPVVTLIGCRNMWVMAQQAVKKLLTEAGAHLIDNIVLTDQGSTLASFITTPRWVLTGRKGSFWGFPPAGIAVSEIQAAKRFGNAIRDALAKNIEKEGRPLLAGLGAANVDISLVQSEKAGYRSFLVWGKLLRAIGKPSNTLRKLILILYIIFLVTLILTVVPVTMILQKIMRPLFKKRFQAIKEHYELPSGSATDRIQNLS